MKTPSSLTLIFVAAQALALTQRTFAASGDLDGGFGIGGRVIQSVGSFTDSSLVMTVQLDGKIVTAGVTDHGVDGGPTDLVLTRRLADGSLDSTFNTGAVPLAQGLFAEEAVLQADGKILLTGSQDGNVALFRFNSSGSLDSTFDTDGRVLTDFGGEDGGVGLALQPDGKIVVTGSNGTDLILARYHPNGSLDTTFDGDGKVVANFGGVPSFPHTSKIDTGNRVVVLPDGKILVSGDAQDGTNAGVILARYNSNGSPDTSFQNGVKTGIGGQSGCAWDLALQSDGKILVGGRTPDINLTTGDPVDIEFLLARFDANGALDTSFSGDGVVTTSFGGTASEGDSIAVQSNGKILLAGSQTTAGVSHFAVARYLPDGSLDDGFGDAGLVSTDFSSSRDAFISTLAVQADGSILASGSFDTGSGLADPDYDFALVRYQSDAPSAIVGSWVLASGAQNNGTAVITFLPNGEYFLAEQGDEGVDPSGQDGIEHGTYVWDPVSGLFAATAYTDTNGDWGISGGEISLSISATTLSGPGFSFNRVSQAPSSLEGSWIIRLGPNDFEDVVITFLSNGNYYLAQDGISGNIGSQDGVEFGAYSWNPVTSAFHASPQIDTNGEWGLSDIGASVTVSISGNTLSLTTFEGTFALTRVSGMNGTPLAGSDDFADNIKDTAKWAANDSQHAGGTLVEANGRLEYRVTAPDPDYDEVFRPWILNRAKNTDAFDVILDVHNQVPGRDITLKNASIGITVTSIQDQRDSIYVELYRGGTDGAGPGFLAALKSNAFGGDEVLPYTVPSNHDVTDGAVRLSYNPATKIFTAYYDTDGSANGYQWTAYGSFGVGASGGGSMRNSPWLLSANQGFEVSVSAFSEGLAITSGQVYADNFSLSTANVSMQPALASLVPSAGTLSPLFAANTTSYTLTVPNTTSSITFSPTVSDANATVKLNDVSVASNTASASLNLPVGTTIAAVVSAAQDRFTTRTYSVTINRQTPFQTWAAGQGLNGANSAPTEDYDGDGVANLLEYALGLNPAQPSSIQLPQAQNSGGNLSIGFTTPVGVSGITYGAEWSPNLQAGSWTPVSNSGVPPQNTFSVPVGSNAKMFIRLVITGQ